MKPGEHKTVQARILKYAEEIGWTIVPREEAEARRGFELQVSPKDRAKNTSLFFNDLLDKKVRTFNPRYSDAKGALIGKFRHLHTDIYGNREFVDHLRNRGKYFDHDENRERDLILIDYRDDLSLPYGTNWIRPAIRMRMPRILNFILRFSMCLK